jgi:protein-S-isoprenylcysteine O-methyltransferase Ste14
MSAFGTKKAGLTTSGIYQHSRNPMYVTGFLLIFGLNLMGMKLSWNYILFLVLNIAWIAGTHWCVLQEEKFLEKKYNKDYRDYKTKVARYLFI